MNVAFDATTDTGGVRPPLPSTSEPESDFAGLDTLTLLKQTVGERVEIPPLTLHVPGGRIRLVCKPDIPERDLRRWQRASLPADKRKSGTGTPLDQNQLVIATLVLTNTCEYIEVLNPRDKTQWLTVEHGGEALGLDSQPVLRLFDAMDVQYLLVKLFGRESDVISASQKVLVEAGWAGENGGDGEDDDPR